MKRNHSGVTAFFFLAMLLASNSYFNKDHGQARGLLQTAGFSHAGTVQPEQFQKNTGIESRGTVFPNVRILPSTLTQQLGIEVTSDPLNPNTLFGSALTSVIGGAFLNSGTYISTDNGLTWRGTDTLNAPNLNDQRGYPSPVIDKNGRYYLTHLTSSTNLGSVTGIGANYSTNGGVTWSSTVQVVNDPNADRPSSATDDSPLSPYYGTVYCTWSTGGTSLSTGRLSRTQNGGVVWTAPRTLNTGASGRNAEGHDVETGPNGDVYVAWAMVVPVAPFNEDFIGFARSTNGGASFITNEAAVDINGTRSFSFNGWSIANYSFPKIAVDKSNSPKRGWIYAVTSQVNLSPAGSDADIVLYRSTDRGQSWSQGFRVNQDAVNNGRVQFFPAVCVDDGGVLHVVYYDNRDFAPSGDSCAVYISSSFDGGASWTDAKLSDHNFLPKPATGFPGGDIGDYIGITSGNGRVVATWMDDKGGPPGNYNVWSGAYEIGTVPLSSFSIQSPAPGGRIEVLANSPEIISLNWDASASTANYKWIFGSPNSEPRLFSIPAFSNNLTLSSGQFDNILASAGVNQGDSITGQWDVWAFRNNQANDSLKSSNGPRTITLKRTLPPLVPFSLLTPPSGTSITTSQFSFDPVNITWTGSGSGTKYRWKLGSPDISNILFSAPSDNNGFNPSLTLNSRSLDGIVAGLGVNPGDSITGQWAAWAYSGRDSLRSGEVFNITIRRKSRGSVLIIYDSTTANGRNSRDSAQSALNSLGVSSDAFNRGVNINTSSISFRGYSKVMLLGEASSVMSNRVKDSLKSYLASGVPSQKAKLIIMAEDIGFHLDRPSSPYYDPDFARNQLGFQYVADNPGTIGGQGLSGVLLNPGTNDSTYGPNPDVLRKSQSLPQLNLYDLYRFRSSPSFINGVGRISSNYHVAVLAVDLESVRRAQDSPSGSSVRRFVKGSLDFVDGLLTGIDAEPVSQVPQSFSLSQNYPNPFNPSTTIRFGLPEESQVSLKVFDILGREVVSILNSKKQAGAYEVKFDASGLASGVYFYRLDAQRVSGGSKLSEIKRMLVIK